MIKKLITFIFVALLSTNVLASGSGQTIEQIFYCGDDFAMKMSGGDWYVVQKSKVGEKKLDHFLSMAMYMVASNKKTGNVFPEAPLDNWCGNSGFKPIRIFGFVN